MKEIISLKQLETSSKILRLLVITISVSTLLLISFGFYKSSKTISEIRKSIYVPTKGASMEMLVSKNYDDNREAEIRNHLLMFHEVFYNLLPDEQYNKNKIETRALYLGDNSLKKEYDRLTEAKYYSNLVGTSAFQRIKVDSISLNYTDYPYKAQVYSTVIITRTSVITERAMVTQCDLVSVKARSERNPHGLLIENFQIIYSQNTKQYDRTK
jgi:conjugative transposon TraK protein